MGLSALSLPLLGMITLDFFFKFNKFSAVIENAVGYNFLCKSLIRQSLGCPLVGKCKMLHFRNSTQKIKFISPFFKRSEKRNVFEEHIFNLSIFIRNPFVTVMVSSGHNNLHKKSMQFSIKKQYPWDCLASDLHKNL